MKKALALFAVVLTLGLSSVAFDAEARRMGGGKSAGMQRQVNPTPAAPGGGANAQGVPGQAAPAAGAAAGAAPAAAAAAKRNWMGPIAGIAAGLGLMALASHFGFGAALANMMLIGLVLMAVLMVVGFVMRKRMGNQNTPLAGAGGAPNAREPFARNAEPYDGGGNSSGNGGSMIGSRIGAGVPGAMSVAPGNSSPAGFDSAAFARNAKTQFLALQSANDAGDLVRLKDYLTPEMFEMVRTDLAARGDVTQKTEAFGLEAQVLSVVEEGDDYVASVLFTGSTRDQPGAVPDELKEIWHLTKPRTGFGGWVIAGIQQVDDAAAT